MNYAACVDCPANRPIYADMGWSITIGRIAGTAVRLHFTFLLFLAWIGIADYIAGGPAVALDSLAFIVLVFACVTLHEFGHILMGRHFGIATPDVILSPIGGIANMERMPEKPMQELLVAIAGPLVNVVIALLLVMAFGIAFGELSNLNFATATLAERLALVNVSLVLFNLVPAFPMDGGRVLRALLAMQMGPRKATAIAARIGQGFAFVFVLLGLFYNPMLMLVGVFIYFAAGSEQQDSAFSSFASRLNVKDAMEPQPIILQHQAPLSEAVDHLLRTPQRDFPVVDGNARAAGFLDREAMLLGLSAHGPDTAIATMMRESLPLPQDMSLIEAFAALRQRGARAEAVIDASGRIVGVLTLENIGEMMMVEKARPGFSFPKRR